MKTGGKRTKKRQKAEALSDDDVVNLTQDTVKTRLHRARLLLQEKLYASVGSMEADAFRFGGARCERMIPTLVGRAS